MIILGDEFGTSRDKSTKVWQEFCVLVTCVIELEILPMYII